MATGKKARRSSNSNAQHPNSMAREGFQAVVPLTFAQGQYLQALKSNSLVFGVGGTGTGKTFIAVGYAAQQLYYRNINKIFVTRPVVETGRSLGAIPGTLNDKFKPYIEVIEDDFRLFLGDGFFDYAIKSKLIEPKPLGFGRGSTYRDCIVIADEMQNATHEEMKMLLTRIGENCTMIVCGDPRQSDIRNSSLADACARLGHIDNVEVVEFLNQDIVRSKLCKDIILAYES